MEADHFPDLPASKGQTMQDSEPKDGKGSEKWVKRHVICPKCSFGRTFSGDYGYRKSVYHFKALAVNMTMNFMI